MSQADFAPETIEITRDMMKGRLRDLVLDHMKDGKQGLPWNLRPESEQKTIIEFVEMSISSAIAEAVQHLARDGKRAIVAQVEQVVVKDGLKIVLKSPHTEENLMMLGSQVGSTVLVTSADPAEYMGAQERKPEPLQQELLNDEGDEGNGGGDAPDDPPVFDGTPSGKK